jgi:hypothetical protein
MAVLMTALPFVAFLGLLLALGAAAVAYFWPTVEWWLLCRLLQRRRDRETRLQGRPRPAVRRPR